MYTYKAVGMNECGKVRRTPRYNPRPYDLMDWRMKVNVLTKGFVLLPLSRVETVSMGYRMTSASQLKRAEATAVTPDS